MDFCAAVLISTKTETFKSAKVSWVDSEHFALGTKLLKMLKIHQKVTINVSKSIIIS